MRAYHWGTLVLIVLVAYMVGVWYPAPGMKLRGTVGM